MTLSLRQPDTLTARQKSYATLNCDTHLVVYSSESCEIAAAVDIDASDDLEHQDSESSKLSCYENGVRR